MNKKQNVLLMMCGLLLCAASGFSEQRTAYTFDYRWNEEQRLLIETLQGIVNRDAPQLYFTQTGSEHSKKTWVDVYRERYRFEFVRISELTELVRIFRGQVNGAVLYDPEIDATRWISAVIGGLDNLLPVAKGSGLEKILGLEVKQDLAGRFGDSLEVYEWALENVMPRCNRTVAHAPAEKTVDGKYIGWGFWGIDYVVANRGFIVNLGCVDEDVVAFGRTIEGTPKQGKMYSRVLEALESPALIFGYGEPELDWFDFIGQHGHTYLHYGNNLSFHAAVKAKNPEFCQKVHVTPDDVSVEEDKYYIAFMTSEGDSMKGPLPFFFGSWFDPARGSVPMNWSIHPEVSRFPAMLEYFYETATTNDLFVGVQVFNFEMKKLEGFARSYAAAMKRADMSVTIADYANPSVDLKKKERFLDWVNPLGAVDVFFEKSTLQGYNYRSGKQKIPLAATGIQMTYWHRMLPGGWSAKWQEMYQTPEGREQVMQAAVKEIHEEAAAHEPPYLIVMYTDLHNFDRLPELHREIVAQLDPDKFKAVRLDEGFSAMRKWNPARTRNLPAR